MNQPARITPEGLGELLRELADAADGLLLACVGQVADFLEGFGADHGADGHRVVGVEHLARLVRRQEGVDLVLVGDVDPFRRMGEDEAVHADHDGDGQLLGEPEGLDVQVSGLLVGLGEELDPAGIPRRHRVAVVVPDVDGSAHGAVGQCHDDGQPEPTGVVERLHHEEEPLAGGGGEGPGAGSRGADGHRHGGELRLDVDELAGRELARLHHFPDRLDDVGLGRDRVGTHDLRAAERHGLGDGPGALNLLEH